ncbi:glycosyltransferase family 39 protein [Candidatus Bathyarchaeota archaeon]|nr:glycosyltransferase family 39 protein [Candidatus Bathyarchaeota archaeon]
MEKVRNFIVYVSLLLILLIGGFTRFYQLGHIPAGISDDEADKGYDAYSLLITGKDQWNVRAPLFAFKGFGDYRSPLYTYLIVPIIPVFGLSEIGIRIPSAVAGTLTICIVYGIGVIIFRRRSVGLISAFLLAINPWHIGMSRMAMEATLGVLFVSLGTFFFLLHGKRIFFIVFSALFFGLTFYSYPGYVVATPILIILLYIGLRKTVCVGKRSVLYNVLAFGIFLSLTIPMVVQVGNVSSGIRMQQVNLTNDSGTVDQVNEKRGACISVFPDTICRVIFNKYQAFFWKFVTNYLQHFSPSLLLTNGTTTQYSILPSRGLLYLTEWVLCIIGVYVLLKKKDKYSFILLSFLLFSAFPDSMTGDGHYGRFFISIPFWQLVSAAGAYEVMLLSRKPLLILVFIAVAGSIEAIFFWVEYNTFFPFRYSRYSHFGYKELMQKVQVLKNTYDDIYISSRENDTKQYIFYLFYTTYDPIRFQIGRDVEKNVESDGWIRVSRIDNIHFVPTLPGITTLSEITNRNILLIGAPSEFSKIPIPPQFTIKDKKGDVVFSAIALQD